VALLLVLLLALVAVVVLVGLTDHLDILRKAGAVGQKTGMASFDQAVSDLQGPVTAGVGTVGTVGGAFGGVLVAMGNPKGMKVVGCSAGGLGAVFGAMGVIE
jgi:hypothetical protein